MKTQVIWSVCSQIFRPGWTVGRRHSYRITCEKPPPDPNDVIFDLRQMLQWMKHGSHMASMDVNCFQCHGLCDQRVGYDRL